MRIEFTREEVETIILQHAQFLTGENFNSVSASAWCNMPSGFIVSKEEKEDEPQ